MILSYLRIGKKKKKKMRTYMFNVTLHIPYIRINFEFNNKNLLSYNNVQFS